MNTKLLASIAVFALLTSVVVASTQMAYADEAKKEEMKAKKDAKAAEMKAKKDAKAAEMKAKVAEKKESTGATSSDSTVVEMAKGTATNTECGDQCYVPNNVQIAVGGTVMWKNVDSAAHTSTDPNGTFDTGLVNAGKSFKQKFDTAGTYEYLCIVHPWMKGTVTVS